MTNTHWKDFFAGKTVTQMGLGLLGRGVNDALFLSEYCEEVIVTDLKSREELDESVQQLAGRDNITLILGEHRLEDFEDRDFILKGAGIPKKNKYIDHAREQNIPVYMDEALMMYLTPGVAVVGITGTRGKTSTTMLLHHILETAGRSIHLGGNIRGIATLPLLEKVREGDVVVMELASWQFHGFEDLGISPPIAAFTNFYDDHLDFYKQDRSLYFADKALIYQNQNPGDVLVLGRGLSKEYQEKIIEEAPAEVFTAQEIEFTYTTPISLLGAHNQKNIEVAVALAERLGISREHIIRGIETFPGVEGRLQFLGTTGGVDYFNDNNATSQEATIAAINALSPRYSHLTVVFGGADKKLDIDTVMESVAEHVATIVLLPGTGSDRVRGLFSEKTAVHEASTMAEAVEVAARETPRGGVVALSPAFASFGLFINEYQRNDQFVAEVSSLLDHD